ncbi:Ig-like domain-containing protein [Kitasatospora sp. NPDC127111]|uniref:Ig-like domain-containing protein n=1 Tax=Kitasatospora sp. NPDC127111 TaxID=3345363 RepID=UPI003628FD0A
MPDTEIRIDTSNLTCHSFSVPEAGPTVFDGSASPPPTVSLPVATPCHLQLGDGGPDRVSVADFTFTVAADGTLAYDPSYDRFLDGRDQRGCLTVHGLPVRLDVQVDHGLQLRISGSAFESHQQYDLRLPPSPSYRLDGVAGGSLDFRLTADGTVLVGPDVVELTKTGVDPQTGVDVLTVSGRTVTVDSTGLDHSIKPNGFARWLPGGVNPLTALPADGYQFQPGSGYFVAWTFGITADGRVSLDHRYDEFARADGTTLTVKGRTVHVDCTALPHDLQLLGVTPTEFPRCATTAFTAVPVAAVPGTGYGLLAGAGIVADVYFRITPDGNVVVDPIHRGCATVTGSTLTLSPKTIHIDATALSHDLETIGFFHPNGNKQLPRTKVNALTAIPAPVTSGYALGSKSDHGPSSIMFGIGQDGHVILDPACTGFATAEGNTLVIHGYPVLIDATQADSDLMGIGNLLSASGPPGVTRLSPRALVAVLLPAGVSALHSYGYYPQTANGTFDDAFGFQLQQDGTVTAQAPTPGGYVVALSASPNPSVAGQAVTFGACVRPAPPGAGTPQGALTFADGPTVLGSAQLDGHGSVSFSTTVLAAGDHEITLTYAGDANFEPSSATLRHRVVPSL